MNVDNHPFDAYVNRPETGLRVARAALLFALDHDPRIPIEGCLRRLDQLAGRVDSFDADTPAEQVVALRTALVDEAGFRGRASDFCDPEASYLHAVLARRHGLPIALAVIWLDVARTLGWDFVGVGLPGRFLVAGPECAGERELIDPFDRGVTRTRADCSALLARCFGRTISLTPDLLAPVGPRAILTRMLHNLRALFLTQEAWGRAECVLLRLLALSPGEPALLHEIDHLRSRIGEQN
jgi:regulator of sirC expression with transglutaminase-like and TPR domain